MKRLHFAPCLLLIFSLFLTRGTLFGQEKLEVLEKRLKDAQKSNKKEDICELLCSIGDYYLERDEFRKASKSYKKSLDRSEEYKYPAGVAIAKNKMGLMFVKKAEYEDALKQFESGLAVAKSNNLPNLVSEINSNISQVESKLNLQQKVNEKYSNIKSMKKEDVVRLMEEENIRQREAEMKEQEAALRQKKDKKQQFAFLEKIKNLSTENQLIAMRLEFKQREIERNKLEIEKSDLQINVLNKERELKNIIIAKKEVETQIQQNIIWFSSIAIIVLLIFSFIIYGGYVQKQKVNKVLVAKNKLIEENNKTIMDSIMYAKKIQEAILTPSELCKEVLQDHFIFYKPKDIVSGDFYWAYTLHNKYAVWVVADCTGHGVPGAFMSMIGNSLLNEIVLQRKIISADLILNELRKSIINSLGQSGVTGEVRDGMDAALCVWNKENNTLEFAGAFNPLYLVRKGELIVIEADKKPIGWHDSHEDSPFTKKEVQLMKGDSLYLFSDGYADQFGGEHGKKFSKKRFKSQLLSIYNKPIDEQKNIMEETFESWRTHKDEEQVDDICVIGVKV